MGGSNKYKKTIKTRIVFKEDKTEQIKNLIENRIFDVAFVNKTLRPNDVIHTVHINHKIEIGNLDGNFSVYIEFSHRKSSVRFNEQLISDLICNACGIAPFELKKKVSKKQKREKSNKKLVERINNVANVILLNENEEKDEEIKEEIKELDEEKEELADDEDNCSNVDPEVDCEDIELKEIDGNDYDNNMRYEYELYKSSLNKTTTTEDADNPAEDLDKNSSFDLTNLVNSNTLTGICIGVVVSKMLHG